MYLGGPLGLMSIGLMAILVRGLGLLMLGVASTAGQLLGSVLIDVLIPSLGNTVYRAMNHPVIGVVTKADLASMEQISLVKSWLREAGAHNVLVTSAVNNNGVTELFALLHTEEGCC